MQDQTTIESNDQKWVEAAYQIYYVLSRGDKEGLSDLYSQSITEVKKT